MRVLASRTSFASPGRPAGAGSCIAACFVLALPAAAGAGGRAPRVAARAAVPAGFPAPPPGAVVYSREDRFDDLALGVAPRGRRLLVQASVVGDEGTGVAGLSVELTLDRVSRRASPCGPGCYRASFAGVRRPRAVVVDVRGRGAATRWRISLPREWPPPDGTRLVRRAAAVWRSLHALTFVDRLASGPGQRVVSDWRIVAPDRVAYTIPHGSASVIIGGRRWDRPAGGRWIASVQDPTLTQPVPFWVDVADAHVLAEGVFDGRPVWRVSFFDPGTPGWFDALFDRRTLRTLDLHMIATAHFMHDTYSNFDGPVAIRPPQA